MTFGTFHLLPGQVDIFRVLELQSAQIVFQIDQVFGRPLGHDYVTGGAFGGDGLAVGITHNAVVTAETSIIDKMTQVIFPNPVIGIHFREKVLIVNTDQLPYSLIDQAGIRIGDLGVLFLIIGRKGGGDGLMSLRSIAVLGIEKIKAGLPDIG